MDLGADQVGPQPCQRVEHVVPLGLAEDQHVVRRCGGWAADGAPTFWNKRVGLGQVDDSVDDDVDRRDAGPPDVDGVAGRRMQVGGGLLCDQDAIVGAGQGADGCRETCSR